MADQEITLSDGSILTLPADMPDDQVIVTVQNAENQLKPQVPGGDPNAPAPVDDSWFPEGEKFPGYTAGHEFLSGAAEGVMDLPNIVPNISNAGRSLVDLHFGSGTGNVEQSPPWFPGLREEVAKNNPQTPGWEGTRNAGRTSGSTLPAVFAAPLAPVVAPMLTAGGAGIGRVVDDITGNEDTHKWERTGEMIAPVLAGGVGRGLNAARGNLAATTLPAMAFFGTGGNLTTGASAAASLLAAKLASKVPMNDLAAASVLPMQDDWRFRRP